ncbi:MULTISPECIES: hypothetical protein [unclassified Frankia]|uniref:hypothetical protein n=1 Tax=unclassified Frankia TaxID=2632575 RepID=UPI001EE4A8D0|nr:MULTISPECIES: hypothetical protein [unclassified Frankia]
MVSLTGGEPRPLTLGQLSAGLRRLAGAPGPRGACLAPALSGDEATPARRVRMLPLRCADGLARGEHGPAGLPAGAVVSVAWQLDGVGSVVGALLPPGHPAAGRLGARVLAGEGVWPATVWPADSEVSRESPLIELAGSPARLVVRAPDRDIVGSLDQPARPPAEAGRLTRATTGLRRGNRQVRIRAGDRVWWLRATGVFGVRVSRGDRPVYLTRGMLGHFEPGADELDVSVVLATLASLPSSTYAPILGF